MDNEPKQGIQLSDEQRALIEALLARHLPGVEAWAFGSRVKGNARPWSDLDLVVFAAPAQEKAVAELRDTFEESDLPFRVDLLVWDEIPNDFRQQIRRNHKVLVKARKDG